MLKSTSKHYAKKKQIYLLKKLLNSQILHESRKNTDMGCWVLWQNNGTLHSVASSPNFAPASQVYVGHYFSKAHSISFSHYKNGRKNQKRESANVKLCFYVQQQVLGFTLVVAIFYSLVSKAQNWLSCTQIEFMSILSLLKIY